MKDALTMCKSAIEANDPTYVSDYSLKLEPDFREATSVFEAKEVQFCNIKNGRNIVKLFSMPFQEPKIDPFNDKNSGFDDDFKSNGFTADPFGSSGFDSGFNARAGFDDSFGNSFPNRADAFGASQGSDPFGDKRGAVQAVTPDVNTKTF